MKKIIFLSILALTGNYLFAQNDSIDVFSYRIRIDSIGNTAHTIKANTAIRLGVLMPGMNSVELSLQQLTVDSVVSQNQQLNFTVNGFHLRIALLNTAQPGDTVSLQIYYHGTPATDPSGWGGTYYTGNYFFNLGVGFQSDPHNFGRAWFPCNDNFTDRAFYSFSVRTNTGFKAFCNGLLTAQINNSDGTITWEWNMTQRIPTYLACVAVAPYYTLRRVSNGIPVEWACMPADTNNILSTFQNLDTILNHYINAYGPYPFDKVGYCLVPFNSGAMEHATSIHIGSGFINGSLSYETLWAHELSHMWFGDHVTCSSQQEMWLNEGFASFNESMITEWIYGLQAYKNWHSSNHRKVLQFAHITDGAYYALNTIPWQDTYGPTVYNKGADVARTLRSYMGDQAFFAGLTYYFNHRADQSVNSIDLRDDLSASSGISLTKFFDEWVFTPGFPHFNVDSIIPDPQIPFTYLISTKQKSKGNSIIYTMPVDLYLSDGVNDTTVTLLIDSLTNSFSVQLPFNPLWIAIDREDKMADAITASEHIITNNGGQTFTETNTSMNVVNAGTGSSTVRIEHHWVAPDLFKSAGSGIRLSDYHYWRIDGNFANGFYAKLNFLYNGSTSTAAGYLDNTLITGVEDSLVLLYRQNAADEWHIPFAYTLQKSGSSTDKVGYITVDTLRKGEYTLGYYDLNTGINTFYPGAGTLTVSSDIHTGSSIINIPAECQHGTLKIFSITGQELFSQPVHGESFIRWNPATVSDSIFIASLKDKTGKTWSVRFNAGTKEH